MDPTGIIIALISVGLGGGIATLLKLKPERQQIIVKSSESLVIASTRLVEELQEENGRLHGEINDLRAHVERLSKNVFRIDVLVRKVEQLETELESRNTTIDTLKRENRRLRERVTSLENGGTK